jgi:PKD repeat protein
VASHTGAIHGTQAFVLVSRDPDRTVADDGIIDLLTWNGTGWSGPSLFAGGGIENRIPTAIFDATGEGHAVWLRGSDLVQATLSDPTPRTIRSGSNSMAFFGLRFLNNPQGNLTLLWEEVADNQPANLFARVFDPASESWSEDRRLTAEEEVKHHSLSGFYGGDGVLRAVYLATQIGRTTRQVELQGQTFTLINIPEDGRTDLRLLEHSLIVDLAVVDADLALDPTSPKSGETVTATLTVHNAGDFPVGSFDVALYTGNPEDQGVLVATQRATGPFAAGSRLSIPFTFVYPASGGDIAVVIDAADEVTELAEGNNIATYHLANRPPQAVILATVTGGFRPLDVEFDASASYDPDGDALFFDWAFGDGGISSGSAVISHRFSRFGRFPVAVVVTDSKGAVGTAIVMITVNDVVPAPPTNLQAAATSPTEIVLTWQDASDNEDGFSIYRATAGGSATLIAQVAAGITTFADQSLTPGTSYFYQVEAFNGAGASPRVGPVAATTPEDESGTDFYTLSPCRLYDSRNADGPLISGVARILQAAGICSVPQTARALAVNVTAFGPTSSGRITLYPAGIDPPLVSTINFTSGITRANNAFPSLDPDGTGTMKAVSFLSGGGSVHLIVDIVGYFE